MNMKKLMAVVLAVVLAISAMAVNVFAGEAEVKKIELLPSAGANVSGTNRVNTWEFTFPIYNLYGYANQDSYLELRLPVALTDTWNAPDHIDWSITVNDFTTNLKPTYGTSGYATQYVTFGALPHGHFTQKGKETVTETVETTVDKKDANGKQLYIDDEGNETTEASKTVENKPVVDNAGNQALDANDKPLYWAADGTQTTEAETKVEFEKATEKKTEEVTKEVEVDIDNWACIPQTVAFNEIKEITLTAQVYLGRSFGYDPTWDPAGRFTAPWAGEKYNAWAQLWTAGADGIKEYGAGDDIKVTNSVTYAYNMTITKNGGNDNTNYKTFDFLSETDDSTVIGLYWDHTLTNRSYILGAESAKLVVELDGTTNGIAYYSLWAKGADASNETVNGGNLWWNEGAWKNPVKSWIDTDFVEGKRSTLEFNVPLDVLYNATYGVGTSIAGSINGEFRIYRQFEQPKENFYSPWGGAYWYNNENVEYKHKAKAIYLELTMPADEDAEQLDVQNPVESDKGEVEEDPADITVPEEPTVEAPKPEKNPTTGVVLAALPMVLAAAAVVVSKRR